MSTVAAVRKNTTVDGLSMSFLEWPDPQKPGACDVLVLHGILQNADGMAGLAHHLSKHHRVVVPDLRGRGQTGQPDDGYDPATMANDVGLLIRELNLRRLVVIGRNHGGVVGYHLAANFPDLVHGLILGDTNPVVGEERAARRRRTIAAIPRSFASMDEAVDFYRRGLGLSEERAHHDIPHDLSEEGDGLVWRHNLEVIAKIEAASTPRSDWDVLARVTTPTLLLRGQRGRVQPEVGTKMVETIQRCEVQTIFGANHDVFIGPGVEQAFGAIDMFLMRLNEE